ncbi:MAG: potassium-transporting ATPase subunit KdpC [Elusimicrobiales bacterium]
MKTTLAALKFLILMTVLTGLAYPLAVWMFARTFSGGAASGGLIWRGGRIIGSKLVAQNFTGPGYFWPRPSAVDYNPMPSGGSNRAPGSAALRDAAKARREKFGADAPADLIFASGSGLDPHISPQAALAQCARVAKARGIDESRLAALALSRAEGSRSGFSGEPRVNVLLLNLALDEWQAATAGHP